MKKWSGERGRVNRKLRQYWLSLRASVYGQDNENRIGRVFVTKSYFSMADES